MTPETANHRYAVVATDWEPVGGVDVSAQRETPMELFQIIVGTN
jgi:hypothetical protein